MGLQSSRKGIALEDGRIEWRGIQVAGKGSGSYGIAQDGTIARQALRLS